jgi:hypothetical protein
VQGRWGVWLALVGCAALSACATPYQERNDLKAFLTGGLIGTAAGGAGGYEQTQLEPGYWRVSFTGTAATNSETVQTYWLYRCAQLTLTQGYQGFETLSDINFVRADTPRIQLAAAHVYLPVIIPEGYDGPPPVIEADIRLLKRPFDAKPPKLFDAAQLQAALAPIVDGPKCHRGNVCPHVHRYLLPADGAK